MDEKAKLVLYRQLKEMAKLSEKNKATALISKEEFLSLGDKEALKYTFEYRDKKTDFGDDVYYIEMPDMDLSGQDLSDVYLSRFMLSRTEDGKRAPSRINLNETKARINLHNLGISKQSQNDIGVYEQVIDFGESNFKGCELFGILPDEYGEDTGRLRGKIVVKGKESLDEEYLKRREEHRLTPEQKNIADRAFERLLAGESLKGLRGTNTTIDLTDYDLREIVKDYDSKENLFREFFIRDIEFLSDIDFIDEYFNEIAWNARTKIIMSEFEKGNMDFVERHFKKLDDLASDKIMQYAYKKGDMDFIEKHSEEMEDKKRYKDIELKSELKEYRKGNMDFVEKSFGVMSFDARTKIIMSEFEKGNMDFVERHFKKLDDLASDKIMQYAYEKGDMDFIENHLIEAPFFTKDEIILKEYRKGNLDFVEKHFDSLSYRMNQIIMSEFEKGNIDFVEKLFKGLIDSKKKAIIQDAYKSGNIEFIKKYFQYLPEDEKERVISKEYEKGNLEFVEHQLKNVNDNLQMKIAKELYQKGNYTSISHLLEEEKITAESHESKIVTCSGKLLATALSKGKVDKDFIIGLINAGSGVNYISHIKNLFDNEHISSLYYALQIKDEDSRREIVTAMLKAGSNPKTYYKSSSNFIRGRHARKDKIEFCLDTKDGYLRNLMKELGMETPDERKTMTPIKRETPKQDNKVLVTDFLTHEVGLSEKEIGELQKSQEQYGRDFYAFSVERLGMQKEILDSCGGTRQAFTRDNRILSVSPKTLYARMMFFRESGIPILPDRLYTTIGMLNKGFAKNFGEKILERGTMEESDYDYKLKQELLKRYPMPETREELKKLLEELNKGEIGGE